MYISKNVIFIIRIKINIITLSYILYNMDQVKNKIQDFRKRKKINQSEIAKHLGISQAAYAKIESGKTNISLDKLFLISDFLDVSIGDLIGDSSLTNVSTSSEKEIKDLKDEIEKLEKRIEEKEAHIDLLVKGQYALQFVIMSYVSQHPNIESRKNMFDNLIQLKVLTKESIENFQTMNKSMGDFISNFKKYTE